MIVRAKVEAAQRKVLLRLVADQQHRQLARQRLRPEAGGEAQRIPAVEREAEQHDIMRIFQQHRPGRSRIDAGRDLQPILLEHGRKPFRLERIGVHDQGAGAGKARGRRILRLDAQVARRLRPQAPGVQHLLRPQQRAEPGEQQAIIDRLGQEVVRPRLQPAHALGLVGQGGDHHDRHMGRARLRLQAPADLIAIHARHHDVEQDHIRHPARHDGQRLRPGPGQRDLVIFVEQLGFEQAAIRRHVIDHQDPRRHATRPRAALRQGVRTQRRVADLSQRCRENVRAPSWSRL